MSPSPKRIGAVILAAGGSSRFGQPKQLIPFRGKSLIRRIIDVAGEAGCAPVIVVIGSEDEKLHREIDCTGVITVENKQWQCGIGSSIRCGIHGLTNSSPDFGASVSLVCDQPTVDVRVIQRLSLCARPPEKYRRIKLCRYARCSRPLFPFRFRRVAFTRRQGRREIDYFAKSGARCVIVIPRRPDSYRHLERLGKARRWIAALKTMKRTPELRASDAKRTWSRQVFETRPSGSALR